MKQVSLCHQPSGKRIGDRIAIADGSLTRLVGLVGRCGLLAGEGLWIMPSSGIHTFGMRFAIDAIGLDAKLSVVRLWPAMKPWRVSAIDFRVKTVLELPAGEIARLTIAAGDQISLSA